MQRELVLLERIQRIDLGIEEIENEKRHYALEVEKATREIEGLEERLLGFRVELDGLEKERRTLERDMEVDIERIKRDEERIKGIKSEKEYHALVKEINAAKKDKMTKEDMVLEITERIDGKGAVIKELEDGLKEKRAYLERLKMGLEDKKALWEGDIKAKEVEREGFVRELTPALLNRYETIRARRHGIAIVPARNGVCQGCYISIPPQLYIRVQSQRDIIFCPHCHRILYWEGNVPLSGGERSV